MILLETDFLFFIGRFHPVLVHLPIGFLILAAIMQFFLKESKSNQLRDILSLVLFLGAISAIAAAVCGWLLANHGAYDDTTLFLHRWLGIGVAIIASLLWLIQKGRIKGGRSFFSGLVLVLFGMILYSGHLGGKLTHGENYLVEYAPGFIQAIFGNEKQDITKLEFSNPDSTLVYKDLIQPFLEKRCFSCHNEETVNGGLILTTKEGILKGGENGVILIPEKAHESEIVNRVTLPASSKKFMPPKGQGLTYHQIRLLEWWINSGASFENTVSQTNTPKEIEILLLKEYDLDTKPKPYVETVKVEAIPGVLFEKLEMLGFKINKLANDNNLLDVSLETGKKSLSNEQLETLAEANAQITWLDFGRSNIKDEQLVYLKAFTNLTLLRLDQTEITDQGIQHLKSLPHLESLNIYGTAVSDKSIESFKAMPALKSLYLWNTKVSKEGLESLKSAKPALEVDAGFQFDNKEKE